MKKFKLFVILPLIILMVIGLFGCKKTEEEVKLNILLPEGIPSISLGGLFDDANYTYTTVSGASLLSSALIGNEYDVIIAPVVLGAQLYAKNTNLYALASILTTGNSYLVSRSEDKISSLKELEGQTIASYGQNTAPDIVLKAALSASGVDLDTITFVYESSVSDVFTNRFLVSEPVKYILSAEPVISKMEVKKFGDDGLSKIDLQEVLKDEMEVIPQAGIFVRKDLDKDVKTFLEKVEENITSLNNDPTSYATLLLNLTSEKKTIFTSLGEDVLIKSIPGSNITYKNALSNKTLLDAYFAMINKYNSNILGGNTIGEEFYFSK